MPEGNTNWSEHVRRLKTGLRLRAFGLSRRTTPVSQGWGFDRGTPIDRYYIDRFLDEYRADVRGDVLEVADNRYTERFGKDIRVTEVLDIDATIERATLVGDLAQPETLPAGRYDCFILTQTLQYVFDLDAAVRSTSRLLKADGVALVTLPSVSRIAASAGVERDFWRFTAASSRRLFAKHFDAVEVRTFGNVLTCAAFLFGYASEEFSRRELEEHDEHFPMLVAVRASRRRRIG